MRISLTLPHSTNARITRIPQRRSIKSPLIISTSYLVKSLSRHFPLFQYTRKPCSTRHMVHACNSQVMFDLHQLSERGCCGAVHCASRSFRRWSATRGSGHKAGPLPVQRNPKKTNSEDARRGSITPSTCPPLLVPTWLSPRCSSAFFTNNVESEPTRQWQSQKTSSCFSVRVTSCEGIGCRGLTTLETL